MKSRRRVNSTVGPTLLIMTMRTKTIELLTVFLFVVTVFGQGEWPRFKSTEENFTISMPAEPKQERTAGRTPLGNGHHIYSLDDNGQLHGQLFGTGQRAHSE